MRELNIPVTTHGRVLIDEGPSAPPLRLLAGCHGYAQSADEMMEMLEENSPNNVKSKKYY